jgi:hypothetical protein
MLLLDSFEVNKITAINNAKLKIIVINKIYIIFIHTTVETKCMLLKSMFF